MLNYTTHECVRKNKRKEISMKIRLTIAALTLVLTIPLCKASSLFDEHIKDFIKTTNARSPAPAIPEFKYHVWPENKVAQGSRIEKESKDFKTCIIMAFFMPGASTPVCTNEHLKKLIEAVEKYKPELKEKDIRVVVVTPNGPDPNAEWALKAGITFTNGEPNIPVVPDPHFHWIGALPILQNHPVHGLIPSRTVAFYDMGKFLHFIKESDNAQTKNTSYEAAMKFWDEYSASEPKH